MIRGSRLIADVRNPNGTAVIHDGIASLRSDRDTHPQLSGDVVTAGSEAA